MTQYLQGEPLEPIKAKLGVNLAAWEGILRRFIQLVEGTETGLSPIEAQQMMALHRRYRRKRIMKELMQSYGSSSSVGVPEIETELIQRYGFSPMAARLYHQWLKELSGCISAKIG